MGLKKSILYHFVNSCGWRTDRKIVVFESDDWGGIRIPNQEAYVYMNSKGILLDNCPYSRYDGYETKSDYDALYEVLRAIKDFRGNSPVFTLNFNTANPDFEKIKDSGFTTYMYESFKETYLRFGNNSFKSLVGGINEKLIFPQYHGREHFNYLMWLDLLKSNSDIRTAFDAGCYALGFDNSLSIKLPYLASYMPYRNFNYLHYATVVKSGADIFTDVFGFAPQSFIAPVYTYELELEVEISKMGINSIQGLYFHSNPVNSLKTYRFLKQTNLANQVQLVRNCFFEPSTLPAIDWVKECFADVRNAFFHQKPAIICTHRLNYMGGLISENRERNLELLYNLISSITERYEDVEFLCSNQLADIIRTHKKNQSSV